MSERGHRPMRPPGPRRGSRSPASGVQDPGRHRPRLVLGDAARRHGRWRRADPALRPRRPARCSFACEVRDFDPVAVPRAEGGPPAGPRRRSSGSRAAADALADAGELGADPARCAVIAAPASAGSPRSRSNCEIYLDAGPVAGQPVLRPDDDAERHRRASSRMQLGWTGPDLCIATACAAGANAIGEGARLIRDGSADVVIAGGTEAPITPLDDRRVRPHGRAEQPQRRPGARVPAVRRRPRRLRDRRGRGVPRARVARAGARAAARAIYGEVAGYGRNSDAYHITAPSPGWRRRRRVHAARARRRRPRRRRRSGTSTRTAPRPRSTTPPRPRRSARSSATTPPPVTSTKGVTGHLIGGAGAAEAVVALLVDPRRRRAADREPRAARRRHRTRRRGRRARDDRLASRCSRTRSGSAGTTRRSVLTASG